MKYESLDDSTAQAGRLEPSATSRTRCKAATDESTIGYIGEFNSGATAVSLPILNEAGIAQVSPGNTAVGITSDDPGGDHGEPDKYYPSGKRAYARVLPKDTYQGAAWSALAKEQGCASAYVLNDKEVYGQGLATQRRTRRQEGRPGDQGQRGHRQDRGQLPLARPGTSPRDRRRVLHLQRDHRQQPSSRSSRTWRPRSPNAPLLGPEGVGETGFFDPDEGGLPADVASRALITIPGVAPEELYPPAQPGRGKGKFNEENPDRYAVYGYESMSLLLDAIKHAGGERQRPRRGR